MQYIYCLCALAALTRLWRSPYIVFKSLLVFSIATRVFWRPSMSAGWWLRWLMASEPATTVLMALAVLEAGYFTTTRMFPQERRRLFTMAALAGAIWAIGLFRMPNTVLGITVGVRTCLQSGIAMFAVFGALYLWRARASDQTPDQPPNPVRRPWDHADDHGLTLVVFLTGSAAVGIWDRFIVDGYHWWIANTVFWCVESACLVHWCFLPGAGSANRGRGQGQDLTHPGARVPTPSCDSLTCRSAG